MLFKRNQFFSSGWIEQVFFIQIIFLSVINKKYFRTSIRNLFFFESWNLLSGPGRCTLIICDHTFCHDMYVYLWLVYLLFICDYFIILLLLTAISSSICLLKALRQLSEGILIKKYLTSCFFFIVTATYTAKLYA